MPYYSKVTSPLTKECVPVISETFEQHRQRLLDCCDTYAYVWRVAQLKVTIVCTPIIAAVLCVALVSLAMAFAFTVASVIYFRFASPSINPVAYERRARAFLNAWHDEIDRSITAPDAQILTPER